MPTPKDVEWMQRALSLAEKAADAGEVPVGAVVICQGEVVGEGWNQPIGAKDPTAHAEVVAIREAARRLGNYRLPECELYVTLEPCTMCVGAIVHARIKRLVYAAEEPKAGTVQSRAALLAADYVNHRVLWEGGVCAEQASAVLQAFFRKRREAKRLAKEQRQG